MNVSRKNILELIKYRYFLPTLSPAAIAIILDSTSAMLVLISGLDVELSSK